MQNVIATTPGEFISGSIIGNVSGSKNLDSKSGKRFFKCSITDGATTIEATSFSRSFQDLEGKRVEIKGRGIRRGDDYNGKICIVVGEKAIYGVSGEAGVTSVSPQTTEPLKTEGKASSGPSRVEGVTVGMAINKAVDIAIAQGGFTNEDIWRHASNLIRLSARLQSGDLAPEGNANLEELMKGPF